MRHCAFQDMELTGIFEDLRWKLDVEYATKKRICKGLRNWRRRRLELREATIRKPPRLLVCSSSRAPMFSRLIHHLQHPYEQHPHWTIRPFRIPRPHQPFFSIATNKDFFLSHPFFISTATHLTPLPRNPLASDVRLRGNAKQRLPSARVTCKASSLSTTTLHDHTHDKVLPSNLTTTSLYTPIDK